MPLLTTPTLGAYSPRPFLDPPGLGNADIVVAMAAGTQSGAYRTEQGHRIQSTLTCN